MATMGLWDRLRSLFRAGGGEDDIVVEGSRVVFRTVERARALDVRTTGWGPAKLEKCNRCGERPREVVFTTAGLGEAQRAVFQRAPLAVDGWICTACGWAAAPRRVSPEEITSFLEEGVRHGEAAQLDDAEYWFLRAASSWPDYPPALGNLAELKCIRAGKALGEERHALEDQAIELFRRAVENDSGIAAPPAFRRELARMEALRGNETSALKRLDALARDNDVSAEAREEARQLAKQVRDGKALFTRAVELADSLLLIGDRSATPLGEDDRARLDEARVLLERAWQRDRTNYATPWMLGKVHQRLGDSALATEHFAHAYECDPDQPNVCREWVLALLQCGRAEEAVEPARRACRLRADDAGLRSNLALTLLLAGEIEEASQTVRDALRLDETDAITQRLARVIDDVQNGAPRPRSLADLQRRAR